MKNQLLWVRNGGSSSFSIRFLVSALTMQLEKKDSGQNLGRARHGVAADSTYIRQQPRIAARKLSSLDQLKTTQSASFARDASSLNSQKHRSPFLPCTTTAPAKPLSGSKERSVQRFSALISRSGQPGLSETLKSHYGTYRQYDR